jgi:hypothetical protein
MIGCKGYIQHHSYLLFINRYCNLHFSLKKFFVWKIRIIFGWTEDLNLNKLSSMNSGTKWYFIFTCQMQKPVEAFSDINIAPMLSVLTTIGRFILIWISHYKCFLFCIQSQFALKAILCIISLPNTIWHGIACSVVR